MKFIVLGVTALWVPASNSCFRSLLSTFEIIANCTQYVYATPLWRYVFMLLILSLQSFYPFQLVISPLKLSGTPIKPMNYFILNKNVLTVPLFLSPLPSFSKLFYPVVWFLLSPTVFKGHQMPKAVNTFQSLFYCLHLLPSLKFFIPLASLTPFLTQFFSLTLQPFLCGYFPIYPETSVFVKKLVLGYFMIALHSP